MRKKCERSFGLLFAWIVFSCLLISGGSRLIGHNGEAEEARAVHVVRAAISSAPVSYAESGVSERSHPDQAAKLTAYADGGSRPDTLVCSDANGNVLSAGTYLHAVYQAFALGDGFV
ncbi:MAG: hypothetical protein IJN79_05075 [Clostridia bacterium]|nr:hypothetical protein [Clostridia bacterium]MBQ4608362.1 hypothetical protein [Clostridia bacterium]MBQ6858814.1 hypothetical protein [Clostridia bacterium]MBQ7052146.1 hypothetical protein [Clostridia bacterium]